MTLNQTTLIRLIEKNKLISKADLQAASDSAKRLECSLEEVLIGRNLIKEEDFGQMLAKHFRVKFINLKDTHIPLNILTLLPEDLATKWRVVVFAKKGSQYFLAMEDPKDLEQIELVRKTLGTGAKIVPWLATNKSIGNSLKLYQQIKNKTEDESGDIERTKISSVVATIEKLLETAVRNEASDIHIEPLSDEVLVRYRIDGVLHDQELLPKDMHSSLIARIKILSDLKLDEQRHPQDGHFAFKSLGGEKISIRVSTVPTVYGEKAVLRILKDALTKFNLEDLGLLLDDRRDVEKILTKSHGMILITGPTGSGKTTSLYTIIGLMNNSAVNILTIEDPVENRIKRINQIQVNAAIGLTFAQGLRSMLRQDPDIIMVGEIRDKETAGIAVNSAMTGHMVLSSIHANNAAGAIPRMIDLGVEPFLLASTLNIIIAQRLVRILCPKCRKAVPLNDLIKEKFSESNSLISDEIKNQVEVNYQSDGCSFCNFTGFKGRTGIFEIITIDEKLKKLIVEKASGSQIREVVRNNGGRTMLEDGLLKVIQKITSIDEIYRVISE